MADEVNANESVSAASTDSDTNNVNGAAPAITSSPDEATNAEAQFGETVNVDAVVDPVPNGNNQKNQNGRSGWKQNQRKNHDSRFNNNNNNNRKNSPRSPEKSSTLAASNDKNEQDDQGKKFTTQSRLFVGNLSADTNEEDLVTIFSKYSVAPDVFLDKQKMYAFVRLVRSYSIF